MRKQGYSQAQIASAIGFHPSTVSRELARNTGLRGYRPTQAQRLASARKATQCRGHKIDADLAGEVEARLRELHSPEQVSGAMAKEGFDAPSHETIYRYIDDEKAAGGSLYTCLRINGKRRYRRRSKAGRSKIPGRVGIEERPACVESRKRFGDWEIDLVEGSKGSGFVLTMAERKSRLTLFEKLSDKRAATVSEALVRRLSGLKVKTLTYDNGLEFAGHLEVARELGAKSYFCAPYHSWEKGLVENHNGLFRQYHAKGSSFAEITADSLQQIEEQLNSRPRKVIEFARPIDYLNKLTAV